MLRLSLVLSCCAALAAQQTSAAPAANRFVPADSCLVVRCAAPAQWSQRFATTQVAKLLHAPALAPFVAQLEDEIDKALAGLRESGKFDVELLEQLMRDYRGELVVSLQLDPEDLVEALTEDRPPAVSLLAALSPAEGIDLAALAAETARRAEEEVEARQQPLRDVTIGDLTLRVATNGDGSQASLPALVDGHLVLTLVNGKDFETTVARLLDDERRDQTAHTGAPLHVVARVAPFMKAVVKAFEERPAATPFDDVVIGLLGLGDLSELTLTVDADDRHMIGEASLSLTGDAQGVLRLLCLEHQPKLLRYLPAGNDWFSTTALDFGALFDVVRTTWTQLEDMAPMSFEEAMQSFTEATKVRLEQDLFAHIGTELMMIDDIDAETDATISDEEAGSMIAGTCIGIALRDGKTFAQNFETMLRSRGLHAARKSEDYGETKIHRLRVGGIVEIEYAITDDLLLLVIGERESARRNLRAVLDSKQAGGAAPDFPPAIEKLLAALPAGWTGVSVAPIGRSLQGLAETFRTAMLMQGLGPDDLEDHEEMKLLEVLGALGADIQRLGIDHIVSTTYATKNSLRGRWRW